MKKIFLVAGFLVLTFAGIAQRLTDFVNPFVGTAGHGHTYPGATLPFGMVQVGPDNGTQGWDWSSGYNYADTIISGFSHTHLSGTGVGDLCDISVLPMTGTPDTGAVRSSFSHKEERASPGFYGVRLRDFSIYAEMTASLRAALHRYAFPASNNSSIRFDLGFAINTDKTTESYWRKVDDSTFLGYRFSTGWAKNQKVFFAVRLSKPVKSTTVFVDKKPTTNIEVTGKNILAYLNFDTKAGEAISMKVGLSFADTEGAVESLNEIRTWDFTTAKRGASDLWERELRKLQINTPDKKTKQIFYTALYHTFLAPTIFSDRFGNYKGVRGEVYNGKMILSTNSLWDTFRAENPLLSITQTEMVPSLVNSFLAFYDQYGYLPVWDLQFNETNTMTGYHAVPVIADAILKNIRGFDYEKAYRAMKKSAMQNIRGTEMYRNFGFVPADRMAESVTITQEYSFDDWCILQVAKKLKKNEDTAAFAHRANNWRNVFDEGSGFFRAKNFKGNWVTPFDPYESNFGTSPYTEGNAWQHSFFVPHDIEGLRKAHTTLDGLENKLDSLFSVSSKITGNAPPDISGLLGQYAHGNEPSHHIAYIYTYLQKQWKTAEKTREITEKFYNNTPDGLAGNEDCGQMSAWYVFSALGFYPVNPVSGEYVFGSPLVDQAIILLPSGSTFRINVTGNSKENIYIQSITLNAKPYTKSFITHHQIMVGGIMEIKMGNKPNKLFGGLASDSP
ncbi:MAG TPA: GH92 family glycosyl hydrolase, partial [Segetibacter sp.]